MSRALKPSGAPAYQTGAMALAMSAAAIVLALGFEHLGGLAPCPLCLQQRYAFYFGVPALFVALVLLAAERAKPAAVLLGLVALAFIANSVLGAYHAGVEWKLWAGPDTCGEPAGALKPLGGLLDPSKPTPRVVRCDEAAFRFLGLSFAGWNVIASILIAIAAIQAALIALEATARAR